LNRLADLQRALHEETDRALALAFTQAETQAGRPYACRAGCSACCHQLVLCTAAEAVLIADHLRSALSPPEVEAMARKLEVQSNAAAGLGCFEYSRRRIPCGFLDSTGACSIYRVRPMACRALKSFSAAACERLPEAPSDLGSSRIPGCGPGLRAARSLGVNHFKLLAERACLDRRDFTLVLPRAVGLTLAAGSPGELPEFGPARCEEQGAGSGSGG
jgi:Fe-S-cluster containining protein